MCCYAECRHSECQRTNENKAEKGFNGSVVMLSVVILSVSAQMKIIQKKVLTACYPFTLWL
jgi:hypothetical protein